MTDIKINGSIISSPATHPQAWQPAVVPGTVLTTLLTNKKIPDLFYGMNNELVQNIYTAGKDYYTYWFVNNFKTPALGVAPW